MDETLASPSNLVTQRDRNAYNKAPPDIVFTQQKQGLSSQSLLIKAAGVLRALSVGRGESACPSDQRRQSVRWLELAAGSSITFHLNTCPLTSNSQT